jgi:CxxC-x17-CxxC domain-containing protein
MGNFDRDRGGRSGGRGFGGRDDRRPSMHKAVCADCGRSCEVPFKPNGEKPVYCNDCFRRDDDGGSRRFDGGGFGGRSESRGGFGDRDRGRDRERPNMHKAICAECGKSCEVPFKPNGEKPVYCSDCFAGGKGGDSYAPKKSDSSSSSVSKDQFVQLNAKLDKILKLLGAADPKSEWKPEKSEKAEKAPKAEPKVKAEKAVEIAAEIIGKAVKAPKAKAKKAVKKGKK